MLVTLALCALAAVLGLTLPTNHDEYQYVAAAWLVSEARPYLDFFYSQTPLFPVALAGWLGLADGLLPSSYLAARLFTIVWSAVFVAALSHVLFRLSPSRLLAAAITIALLCTEILDLPLQTARNDMMPLALATVALALMVHAFWVGQIAARARAALHLVAGVLLALAVGTKQSYAFVAGVAALATLLSPHLPPGPRLRSQFLPLAAGGALGALPLALLTAPDIENFLYANLEFHRTHHLWWSSRTPEEEAAISSLAVRAYVLARTLATAPMVLLGLLFAACLSLALARGQSAGQEERRLWGVLFLAGGTVLVAIPVLMMPMPLHPHYAAPVLPFIGACAVAAAALACRAAPVRPLLRWAGVAVLATTLAYGLITPQRGAIARLHDVATAVLRGEGDDSAGDGAWVGAHAARVEARLREVLGPPRRDLRIATIMNIYPAGAGFGVYRELAGAPFFYQTNDRIAPVQLRRLVGTSPRLAPAWLAEAEVQVVLVGYMVQLDAPLRGYAQGQGFLCFRVDLRGGQSDHPDPGAGELWVAAALARAAPDCG